MTVIRSSADQAVAGSGTFAHPLGRGSRRLQLEGNAADVSPGEPADAHPQVNRVDGYVAIIQHVARLRAAQQANVADPGDAQQPVLMRRDRDGQGLKGHVPDEPAIRSQCAGCLPWLPESGPSGCFTQPPTSLSARGSRRAAPPASGSGVSPGARPPAGAGNPAAPPRLPGQSHRRLPGRYPAGLAAFRGDPAGQLLAGQRGHHRSSPAKRLNSVGGRAGPLQLEGDLPQCARGIHPANSAAPQPGAVRSPCDGHTARRAATRRVARRRAGRWRA